jgi:hypothetical protein
VLAASDGMLESHLILAQGAFALNDAGAAREGPARRWPSSPIPSWPS